MRLIQVGLSKGFIFKKFVIAVTNRVRSATFASAQQLGSTPSLPQHTVNMAPTTTVGQFNKQPVYRPSFARNDQQQVLGSSPEIHNVGTRANTHFMRRAQSNARGFTSNARSTNYSDEKV